MEILETKIPYVQIIKDFISPEEVNTINSALCSLSESDWNLFDAERRIQRYKNLKKQKEISGSNPTGRSDVWDSMTIGTTDIQKSRNMYPKFPLDLVFDIEKRMQSTAEKHFEEDLLIQLSGLHRWRVGRLQEPHIDYFDPEEDYDWEELAKYRIWPESAEKFGKTFFDKHYSSLVYFNSDYVGGSLYMPQYDFEIQPEPGMLISFKGDSKHLHGVREVTQGVRHTLSVFWTKRSWYDIPGNSQIFPGRHP
jgi:predicted DNA-binding protein with PD1-like motif